jgi:hypothetical protein
MGQPEMQPGMNPSEPMDIDMLIKQAQDQAVASQPQNIIQTEMEANAAGPGGIAPAQVG